MSYVALIGSRSLPRSSASQVDFIVGSLLARGRFVGSGGALGADLFALQALVRRGRAACFGSVVMLPGGLSSAPSQSRSLLVHFVRRGGRVVVGPAPSHASRREFVAALFGRSSALVEGSVGVVGFVTGRSAGSWFTIRCAAERGLPVVVFPVEGHRGLRQLGGGRWVSVRCWAGAFRWVSGPASFERRLS
jgi:predicted Rossmann fold nucleotide-binding protein DprA/Smf involved in DNA uptake